jgi:AraC-like DNA-binding protein
MGYREVLQPAPLIACLWSRDALPEPRRQPVFPDACVDVVWISGHRLLVAGPATGPKLSSIPAGAAVMGVRFRVGAAGAALGMPARELLDATVPLEDVWGREGEWIAERVAAPATPALQLTVLANEVRARLPYELDRIVRAAAVRPEERVDRLGHALGIGERQLRRRFVNAIGYGPKTLQRILRFQRFLALAQGEDESWDLARLALDAGYADQAHLTRECRRLSGFTPTELLASGIGPAGDRSVPFKTPELAPFTLAA